MNNFWRMATAAVALLVAPSVVTAADVTIRYAHPTSNNSTGGKMVLHFQQRLDELSGGTMEVAIFPDGQLGNLSEMNELVASGTIQMSHNTWGSLSVFLPAAGALDSPYIFADPQERQDLLTHAASEVLNTINAELVDNGSGLTIVAPYGASARQVTCNRQILSPADLDGVKFRAIPFPVFIATVQGMGAIPVPIQYSELTTALATGLVDCQENPLTNIFNDKLYENQSHIMMTNHIISGGPILVNSDFYAGLSEEQQGWLATAAIEAANAQLSEAASVGADLTEQLEGLGLTFVTAEDGLEIDAFAERVAVEMAAEFGSQYQPILDLIAAEKDALLNN